MVSRLVYSDPNRARHLQVGLSRRPTQSTLLMLIGLVSLMLLVNAALHF